MFGGARPPTMEDLIRQHQALLYRYAYRLSGSSADAEDLTQQAFLTACEYLHQLRDPAAAKSWLCAILRHAFLKTRRNRPVMLPLDHVTEPWQEASPPRLDEETLQQRLAELPEEYRSAVILFYFQELSYKEIAEALEIPLGTVMSRLSRGKSLLKSQWALHDPEFAGREPAHSRPRPQSASRLEPDLHLSESRN